MIWSKNILLFLCFAHCLLDCLLSFFFGIISKPCSYSYTYIVQIFTYFLRNLAFILKLYLMLYAYYRTNIDTALMPIEPTKVVYSEMRNSND